MCPEGSPGTPTILVLKRTNSHYWFFYIISWTILNKAGVQGSSDGTIGKTIGTNGNDNGTIGSFNGTIGKPVLPLVSQWCHW